MNYEDLENDIKMQNLKGVFWSLNVIDIFRHNIFVNLLYSSSMVMPSSSRAESFSYYEII